MLKVLNGTINANKEPLFYKTVPLKGQLDFGLVPVSFLERG